VPFSSLRTATRTDVSSVLRTTGMGSGDGEGVAVEEDHDVHGPGTGGGLGRQQVQLAGMLFSSGDDPIGPVRVPARHVLEVGVRREGLRDVGVHEGVLDIDPGSLGGLAVAASSGHTEWMS